MKRGEKFTPVARVVLAVVAVYGAVAVAGFLGATIGAVVPCTGKFCELGQVFEGALIGGVIGLALAGGIAHLLGMRWWFIPLTAGLVVVAAWGGFNTADIVTYAFMVLGVTAPVIAALTAARLAKRTVGIALGALAALIAVAVAGMALMDQYEKRRHAQWQAARFRTTPIPLHAPAHLSDAEVRLTAADEHRVIYDLRTPAHDGWLRVVLAPDDPHCGWKNRTEVGDGIVVPGNGTDYGRVCRDLGEVTAEFWPDGGSSDWTGPQILEVAAELVPADAQWFIEHSQ